MPNNMAIQQLANRLRRNVIVAAVPFYSTFAIAQGEPDIGGAQSSNESLPAITVTSRKSVEERFFSSGSRVVIDREDIESLGAATVTDVLQQLPGVSISSNATGSLVVRMRGMDSGATHILVDGRRVSNGRSQLALDQLPADAIEKIEVIRAPVAEYSGATAGTINIVTRQGGLATEGRLQISESFVNRRFEPQIALTYNLPLNLTEATSRPSANSREVDSPTGGSKSARPWSLFINISSGKTPLESNNYRETNLNGLFNQGSSGSASYTRTNNSLIARIGGNIGFNDQLTFGVIVSQSDSIGESQSGGSNRGVSEINSVSTAEKYSFSRLHDQFSIDWVHNFLFAKMEAGIARSGTRTETSRFGDISSSQLTKKDASTYLYSENPVDSLSNFKLKFSGIGQLVDWSGGTQIDRQLLKFSSASYSSLGYVPFSLQPIIERSAFWLQKEWLINASNSAVFGGRTETYGLSGVDSAGATDRTWRAFQPSIHFRSLLSDDLQLRLNVARTTRYPEIFSLIDRTTPATGVNSISNPDTAGNSKLKPERAIAIDFGLERRLDAGGVAGINFFARKVQDSINITMATTHDRWVQTRANLGPAVVWGIEGDYKSDLPSIMGVRNLKFTSHMAVLQSRLETGSGKGQRISGQPYYVGQIGVSKPMPKSSGWYGGASLSMTGAARFNISSEIIGHDQARASLDLFLGQRLSPTVYWRLGIAGWGTHYARSRQYESTGPSEIVADSTLFLYPRIYSTLTFQF